MTTVAIAKRADARIAKGKLGVYFAWGAFSKRDGQTFTDSHGDQIPDDEMIAGALSLAKSAQLGHEHDGTITGSVPLVMPMTEDVQAALELTSPHAGLVVGFTPTAEVAKSIDESLAAGEPWQMSIEGLALAEPVAKSAAPGDVAKAEHKRTLRNLTINKIDLVRAAAHGAGTAIAIAKRADASPAVPVRKATPALTSVDAGHQHGVEDVDVDLGKTGEATSPGAEEPHCHPFLRGPDGSLVVGVADGHSHQLDQTGGAPATSPTEIAMSQTPDLAKQLADAQALTAAVLALPADQLAYAKRLDGAGLVAFVAKSATERAEAAKPVHVAKSGEVFYASDDARLVSMAKAHDAMAEQVELAKAATATAEIAKAAAALPNVKGADLIAKAIHSGALTADERKSALADLAAVNASIALITQPIGKGGAPGPSSALEAFDAGLATFAKAAGKAPDAIADEFMSTPEGQRLYAAYEAERGIARA